MVQSLRSGASPSCDDHPGIEEGTPIFETWRDTLQVEPNYSIGESFPEFGGHP